MIKFPKILNGAMAALGAAMMVSSAAAQDPPRLQTNETYVTEATTRSQTLAIDDPMAVFAYVLGSLPERVKVYPTENHYYFSFDLNGTRYAGNIKIDARLRAEGQVEFSYYEDRAAWLQDTEGTGLALGPSRGVTVEKLEPLAYRVSYGKKSVVFALNDLSQVKPPARFLKACAHVIGRDAASPAAARWRHGRFPAQARNMRRPPPPQCADWSRSDRRSQGPLGCGIPCRASLQSAHRRRF